MKVGDLVRMRKGYGGGVLGDIGQLIRVVPSRRGIKLFTVMWSTGEVRRISAAIIERVK